MKKAKTKTQRDSAEARRNAGAYNASADELRAIDEADRSGIASERDIKAAFRSFRPSS